MTQQTQITCDGCGSDLTTTGNSIGYRIVLANETIPSVGGFVTAMMVYPQLDGAKHFCTVRCLLAWAATFAAGVPVVEPEGTPSDG